MAPITSALRRLMTAEGARVTADRDEFCGICDAVDSIHARKLKALDASTRRVDELCKENERLRGLLEAVLQCAGETKRDKGCDACPMYNGPWRNDGTWCLLRPTLRELGVDDG